MTRTWIVENTWTCTSCSASNKGRYTSCQQCGNPKDEREAAAETIDPTATVTAPELLTQAQEGPHWRCAYCAGTARNGNACANCGGKTPDPPRVDKGTHFETDFGPLLQEQRRILERRQRPPVTAQGVIEASRAVVRWAHIVTAGVTVAAFVITGIWWLVAPHEFSATVTSMKWVHIARYEERVVQHSQGWGTPFGAFNTSCQTRYYGTESCHPHDCNPHQQSYQCNGHSCNCRTTQHCRNLKNGFSSCSESTSCSTCYSTCYRTVYSTCYEQCPVYRSWCDYDFYQWVGRGERTLSGSAPGTMTWPDLGPVDETHRLQKTPAYVVNFQAKDEKYTHAPDTADDFARFADGQQWVCEKRVVGFFKPLRRKP